MIQWVVEAARAADVTDRVIVATPDEEIATAARFFGAEVVMTSPSHPSGTDRLAEVATHVDCDLFVNVQGDEPLISPDTIRACVQPMLADPRVEMASVYSHCSADEIDTAAVVKVVMDRDGYALYFSRFAIPYPRNPRPEPVFKHVGIYSYTSRVLMSFSGWRIGALEAAESLEQLRFMENGVRIKMSLGAGSELAVDTPEQAATVREILAR